MAVTYEAAYSILQLPVGAPLADVRAAYKRLALQWHPDKQSAAAAAPTGSQEDGSAPFTQLQAAYQLLCQAADTATGPGPGSATGAGGAWRQQLLEEALAAGLLAPAALLAMQQQLEAGGPQGPAEEALWGQLQRRLARRQQRAAAGSNGGTAAADTRHDSQGRGSSHPAATAASCTSSSGALQPMHHPAASARSSDAPGSQQQSGHGMHWLLEQVWGSTAACRVVVPMPPGPPGRCPHCQGASGDSRAADAGQQDDWVGAVCSCGAAAGVVRYSWRVYWVWARRLLLLRVAAGLLHRGSRRERRQRVFW